MLHQEVTPSQTAYELRLDQAMRASHALTNEVLDANDRDLIIQVIVEANAAQPIQLDESTFHMVAEEPPAIAGEPLPTEARELNLRLTISARGAVHALSGAPVHQTSSSGGSSQLTANFTLAANGSYDSEGLTALRARWLGALRVSVSAANTVIEAEREKLAAAVERIAGVRWDRRRALAAAAAAAGIPLAPVESSGASVPLAPKLLTLDSATEAVGRGASEASLSENIADELVKMISAFSNALERMPVTANQLVGEDEESIRDVLLFLFNANWRGAVTGESFVGSGKTDILLRWRDRDAFIGECKIWKGESAFRDGLSQLLERYTVWRATRVAMVLFIRDRADIGAVIQKARDVITSHDRFIRAVPGSEPEAFELHAQHDRGQIVKMNLVTVVLPQ